MQKALSERCEAANAAVHAMKTLLLQVQTVLFPDITHAEPVVSTHPATYQLFSKPEEQQKEEESIKREIDTDESSVLLAVVEPTKTEVEEDRQLRHRILLGLLQLACAMVRPSAKNYCKTSQQVFIPSFLQSVLFLLLYINAFYVHITYTIVLYCNCTAVCWHCR